MSSIILILMKLFIVISIIFVSVAMCGGILDCLTLVIKKCKKPGFREMSS